jgi:hypothetical protein
VKFHCRARGGMSTIYYKCESLPFLRPRSLYLKENPESEGALSRLIFEELNSVKLSDTNNMFDWTAFPSEELAEKAKFRLKEGGQFNIRTFLIRCLSEHTALRVIFESAEQNTFKLQSPSNRKRSGAHHDEDDNKRVCLSTIYFFPRLLRESPTYCTENRIKLGYYVVNREWGPFDEMYIDLSSYRKDLRTLATAQAIARAWEHCTNVEFAWLEGAKFLANVRTRIGIKNYVNVFTARTQSGKTKFNILLMYFTSLAFGVVSVGLVRNVGGGDHKERYVQEMKDLSKHIIEYLKETYEMPHMLLDIFDIRTFDRTQLKRMNMKKDDGQTFGNWWRPYVVVDRQNKTTYDKLCGLLLNGDLESNSIIREDGQRIFRYALFCDEDDECTASAKRDKLETEKAAYQVVREELVEEKEERDALAIKEFLLNDTIREKCFMLTATSATFFNIIFMDVGNIVPVPLRIPIPCNYKGFFIGNENEIKIITTEEHITGRGLTPSQRDLGITDALEHASNRYNSDGFPHVSLLVNTRAVRERGRGVELAAELCLMADRPNVSFAFYCLSTICFNVPREFVDERDVKNIPNSIMNRIESVNVTLKPEENEHLDIYTFEVNFTHDSRTLGRCYDIAVVISDYLAFDKKYFICVAGALAGRCMTFKTTHHSYPLTHMFLSSMTESASNFGDVMQGAGRISSVDDVDCERYLFCPTSVKEWLSKGYQAYANIHHLFTSNPDLTYEQAIKLLDDNHRAFFEYIVQNGEKISKRSYCDSIYSKISNEAVFSGTIQTITPEEEEQNYTKRRGESQTAKCLESFFKRHENEEHTPIEIAHELLKENLCQVYEQGQPLPKALSDAHFVYQRKAQDYADKGTERHNASTIADRIRRELHNYRRTVYKEVAFAGEGVEGSKRYSLRNFKPESV